MSEKTVICPICTRVLPAVGADEQTVPGHGDGWRQCEGAYHKGIQDVGTLPIGAVVFWKDGAYVPYTGAEREALLRLAYEQQPLPLGVEMRADFYHQNRLLNWEDVNWETAGYRVRGVPPTEWEHD